MIESLEDKGARENEIQQQLDFQSFGHECLLLWHQLSVLLHFFGVVVEDKQELDYLSDRAVDAEDGDQVGAEDSPHDCVLDVLIGCCG